MNEISSRESLLRYLAELVKELDEIGDNYDRQKAFFESIRGWYNLSLIDFLSAMERALGDLPRGPSPTDDPGAWAAIAWMLRAGKSYE